MKVISEPLKGLKVIQPNVYEDARGYFYESFNQNAFKDLGIKENFVQDNQSLSNRGVLRGLHYQKPPMAQGKLVRVVKGSVLDVVVDLRKDSSTYGQHYCLELTEQNKLLLYVPEGFAHGFVVLQDQTIFSYKCTNFYSPEHEEGIMWNDADLNINWKIESPLLSAKDEKNLKFKDFVTPF